MNHQTPSSWWFQIFLIFTRTWGNGPIWLSHIFQMGWFNHQLVVCVCVLISFSEGMFGFRPFWDESIVPASPGKSVQKIDWLWWNMSLPCRNVLEDKLYATICLQNSESFFRMSLTFQECTLQTEAPLKTPKKGMTFQKGEGLKEVPISKSLLKFSLFSWFIYLTLSSMTLTTILASSILRWSSHFVYLFVKTITVWMWIGFTPLVEIRHRKFKKPDHWSLSSGFKYFLFSTPTWGMIQFDEHIFQMGWNHQRYSQTIGSFYCVHSLRVW